MTRQDFVNGLIKQQKLYWKRELANENIIKVLVMTFATAAFSAFSVPVHATKMDDRIESSAKNRSLSESNIAVDVKDGIAILRGDAFSQTQKELATEHARDIEGVKDVINELIVPKPSQKTRTAGEKIDDASITAQVKITLLYNRSTSALNTSVTTKRGVVTLGGKASNASELNLATKLANNVIGVKRVKNLMTIE